MRKVVGHVQIYYKVRPNVSRFDQKLLRKQVEKKVRFKYRKDGHGFIKNFGRHTMISIP